MFQHGHSDPVVICPYDSNHKIARSRIQKHIVKCEKKFPAGYKQQCPYDATHRLFEHEMINHVEKCPMRFAFENGCNQLGRLPVIDTEAESLIENDEVWDEGTTATIDSNPFNEPVFDTINVNSGPTLRGKAMILKRYGSTLRRPFGLPESMMLDTSNQESDDDAESVTSDRVVGRGQNIMMNLRGNSRGSIRGLRRGLRGRLLH